METGKSTIDLPPKKYPDRMPTGKRGRHYARTGLNALKARVKIRGLHAIDQRTAAAQALLGWRNDLIDALGGEDQITPQHRQIVELVVRTRLYVDTIDSWLLENGETLMAGRGRKRTVIPVLTQRTALANSLVQHLATLGLEKRQGKQITLGEYMATMSKEPSRVEP